MTKEQKRALKERVFKIQDKLPANYVEMAIIIDPSLTGMEGKIRAAKNLDTPNEKIVIALEKAAEQFDKFKKELA